MTIANDQGYITLQAFLALWSMTTLLNYRTTLSYLAYLGYQAFSQPEVPLTHALEITSPRKTERNKGKSSRHVFTALLLGGAGCGKSSLMRSFIGKDVKGVPYESTNHVQAVVNSVEFKGAEKYLVVSLHLDCVRIC